MNRVRKVDLDEIKTFYDPHPGFAGAAIPIPAAVKKVADGLDGRRLSLREAVDSLQAVTPGKVEVVAEFDFIGLRLDGSGRHLSHFFRVIRYR
jgi:hypothetical protein